MFPDAVQAEKAYCSPDSSDQVNGQLWVDAVSLADFDRTLSDHVPSDRMLSVKEWNHNVVSAIVEHGKRDNAGFL
jgi:hypothetical protein